MLGAGLEEEGVRQVLPGPESHISPPTPPHSPSGCAAWSLWLVRGPVHFSLQDSILTLGEGPRAMFMEPSGWWGWRPETTHAAWAGSQCPF